eukprot:8928952-Pyramimonas_sp.AAC.1
MVPIIWSAVAEDATQSILDWIEHLLLVSGGAFVDATCSETFTTIKLRETYDALYKALQALGVH